MIDFLAIKRVFSWIVLLLAVTVSGCSSGEPGSGSTGGSGPNRLSTQAQQSPQVFEKTKYFLYLPPDYGTSEKRWPIILYLHGGSQRGDNLDNLKSYGLAALLDKGLSVPFVVVSPQCPANSSWVDHEETLIQLVDNISSAYQVDPERIYLTGHSLGGRGTWFLAYRHPEKFAAIVPVADAPTDESWASQIAKVPIWTLHGTKDDLAPFEKTEKFVETLKKLGADVKLTPLPDRDHYILDVYENNDIYDWMLTHKKNGIEG
jgi:predicted peptidase